MKEMSVIDQSPINLPAVAHPADAKGSRLKSGIDEIDQTPDKTNSGDGERGREPAGLSPAWMNNNMATYLSLDHEEIDRCPDLEPEKLPDSWKGNNAGEILVENAETKKQIPVSTCRRSASRLLVVDDQEVNLRNLAAILGKLDFEVVRAKSSAQAIERMDACCPDLVLIDLPNPGVDGLKLCRRIRQNWAGTPVIIHAVDGDKGLATKAFENGASDCMTNATDHNELISRIRTQLLQKKSRDDLKQLAEDKEEALDILMHDLKNHLVGMQMSTEVLHDIKKLPDHYRSRMLENIGRSSGQMLSLVNRFLASPRTNRQLVIKLEPVNFAQAASRSVELFQEAARRKELVVHASLPGEPTLVKADPNALNQVLDNLLSNAVKFSPLGKQISVVVRPAVTYVECLIRDQGHGFTPDDKKRMFGRFERLSARPTGNESSSGLGLSIVKKLMDAMSGELILESSRGRGAKFYVRLPRATA